MRTASALICAATILFALGSHASADEPFRQVLTMLGRMCISMPGRQRVEIPRRAAR